jgi:hypothetical protein
MSQQDLFPKKMCFVMVYCNCGYGFIAHSPIERLPGHNCKYRPNEFCNYSGLYGLSEPSPYLPLWRKNGNGTHED